MKRLDRVAYLAILALTFLLVNWRASTPSIQRVAATGMDPFALLEIVLACGLAAGVLASLRRQQLLRAFGGSWRGQPLLSFFGILGLLSVAWSISPGVTLYKWTVFALATLVGAYLGFLGRTQGLLRVLSWVIAVAVVLSTALAILLPSIGRMPLETYDRAWRGIFWHKNHLGTMAGLWSVVPLYLLEDDWKRNHRRLLPDIVLYSACAALVMLSRSATGLIVLLAAACLSGAALAWQRNRSRMTRSRYLQVAALGVAMILLITLNFESLLAIMGKEVSLTGRVPMWLAVLREYVSRRPILGYGLGAFWNLEANRMEVRALAGWPYPVAIGDNGWLDVLLGLGAVGLGTFVLLQLHMLLQGIRRAWQGRAFADTLPLTILLLATIANIPFSLFFEIEAGLWLVLVASLFLPTPESPSPVTAAGYACLSNREPS